MFKQLTRAIAAPLAGAVRQLAEARQRFRIDARGVAAIEMAIIFPMMMVLYFGMVDVTNLLAANRRVTLAASTIADLVTQAPGTITKADLIGFYNAVEPILDPFPTADVGIQVYTYQRVGGNAVLRWDDSSGNSCGAGPSTTGMIDLMSENNDIVVAMVCITTKPITGQVVGQDNYVLTDQIALRPRQSATLMCTGC